MYLTKFEIKNIKCFEHVELEFPRKRNGDYSGWNVLLGANGTGKSTLMQAMAIALVGPVTGQRLLYNPAGWTRACADRGEIRAWIAPGRHDSAMGQPRKKPYEAAFVVTGAAPVEVEGKPYDQPQLVQMKNDRLGLLKGPYAANRPGWLACGYGPFRRLTGMGGSEEHDLVYSPGRGRRLATLFREGVAITNCSEWLVSLYSRSVDPSQPDSAKLKEDLALIQQVINSLLPEAVRLVRVDSTKVYFRTIGGVEVTVPDLSDGYRSFLALVVDLLRHIHESVNDFSSVVLREEGEPRIGMEGVVLIDEVDAHLHPLWQREIGFRLCRAFPELQFIVTSHSPFVAQAADDHGLFVLRQPPGEQSVEGAQPVDSVRGWRVDQILTNQLLFDLEGTRDRETEALIRKHGELVGKREWGQLSTPEQQELVDIERELAERLTAPGETPEQRSQEAAMREFVSKTEEKLRNPR